MATAGCGMSWEEGDARELRKNKDLRRRKLNEEDDNGNKELTQTIWGPGKSNKRPRVTKMRNEGALFNTEEKMAGKENWNQPHVLPSIDARFLYKVDLIGYCCWCSGAERHFIIESRGGEETLAWPSYANTPRKKKKKRFHLLLFSLLELEERQEKATSL